jgi:hypothetical protein
MPGGTDERSEPCEEPQFFCEPVERAGAGGQLWLIWCRRCGGCLGAAASQLGEEVRKTAHKACCRGKPSVDYD